MDSKQYIIFATSELDKINFDEVMETSADTVRRSIDGLKTFVKYTGNMPASVSSLDSKEGPHTHEQMLTTLETSEWFVKPDWANN
jgi:hypothetical protein